MSVLPKKAPPKFSKPAALKSTVGQSLIQDDQSPDSLSGIPLLRTPTIGSRGGWLERFKGLKPRELAFIATGLGVLIMAPLTEYLMVNPKPGARSLQGGFSQRGSAFSEGSPGTYEGGLQGIAQGGLVGQEGDVITPLGARDPSQLIVGPAGEDKSASAPSSPATSAAPKQDDSSTSGGGSSWKEALSAAKSGASAAMHKASGLPRPSQTLSGALRGLSAISSGSGGGPSATISTPKLDTPSSKGLISPPRQESSLSRIQTAPGFRGTASGGMGLLNTARSSSGFNPGGGAAYLQDMSYGKSSSGGTPEGASGKPSEAQDAKASGTSSKDAKTATTGDNLALLRAKMEQEKGIDLKYKKLEYQQVEKKKIWDQAIAQAMAQLPGQILQAATQALLTNRQQGQGGGGGGGQGGGGGGQGNIGPTSAVQDPANPGNVLGGRRGTANVVDQNTTSGQTTEGGKTTSIQGPKGPVPIDSLPPEHQQFIKDNPNTPVTLNGNGGLDSGGQEVNPPPKSNSGGKSE